MPRKGSKNRKKVEGDITIQQFADSPLSIARIKKTLKSPVNQLVHNEHLVEDNNNDDDLDLFSKNKCINSKKNESSNDNVEYNDYHIDIWFLISEHINPEDTGRFAIICKKTDAVVSSPRYWLHLYRRFYSPKLILPEKFKPEQIKIVHGIRARVISSLFFTYPPFVSRLSKQPRNLSNLENLTLIQSWYKSLTTNWMFCYRFKISINIRKPEKNHFNNINEDDDDDDIFKNLGKIYDNFFTAYNNVFDNKYEGQHLLIILTDRFIPLPKLNTNNNILNLIKQPLAKNNFDTGLEMHFSNYRNIVTDKVKYDTIINYRILNWWDPEFSLFEILN